MHLQLYFEVLRYAHSDLTISPLDEGTCCFLSLSIKSILTFVRVSLVFLTLHRFAIELGNIVYSLYFRPIHTSLLRDIYIYTTLTLTLYIYTSNRGCYLPPVTPPDVIMFLPAPSSPTFIYWRLNPLQILSVAISSTSCRSQGCRRQHLLSLRLCLETRPKKPYTGTRWIETKWGRHFVNVAPPLEHLLFVSSVVKARGSTMSLVCFLHPPCDALKTQHHVVSTASSNWASTFRKTGMPAVV